MFWAKWDIEAGYDYVQLQVSTDGGASWIPQCGKYTTSGTSDQDPGNPLWDGTQNSWVQEEIDLSDYLGQTIEFRFQLVSDNWINEDGFYFDDFEVTTISAPSSIDETPFHSFDTEQNTPNPSYGYTYVNYVLPSNASNPRFVVTNSLGQEVDNLLIDAKSKSIRLNTSHYESGVYLYYMQSGNLRSASKRMIVVE